MKTLEQTRKLKFDARSEYIKDRDKLVKVRSRLKQKLVAKFSPGKTTKEIAAYALEVHNMLLSKSLREMVADYSHFMSFSKATIERAKNFVGPA